MSINPELHQGKLPIPLSIQGRQDWQEHLSKMAIIDHLGAEVDLSDKYVVRLRLANRKGAHAGGLGTEALNGAIISGMIDCAMSIVGILHFRGRACGTVQFSIQFMKSVRDPHPFIECWAIRRSHSLLFVEACILGRNQRSEVVATGMVAVSNSSPARQPSETRWLAPAGMELSSSLEPSSLVS